MSAPPVDAAALAAFEEVLAELAPAGARRAQMMGRPMLALDRRMFACLEGDRLGVRLGAGTAEHAAALALPGADLFSPGARGRSFRGWVEVPVEHADRWPDLVAAALAHLRGVPPR